MGHTYTKNWLFIRNSNVTRNLWSSWAGVILCASLRPVHVPITDSHTIPTDPAVLLPSFLFLSSRSCGYHHPNPRPRCLSLRLWLWFSSNCVLFPSLPTYICSSYREYSLKYESVKSQLCSEPSESNQKSFRYLWDPLSLCPGASLPSTSATHSSFDSPVSPQACWAPPMAKLWLLTPSALMDPSLSLFTSPNQRASSVSLSKIPLSTATLCLIFLLLFISMCHIIYLYIICLWIVFPTTISAKTGHPGTSQLMENWDI